MDTICARLTLLQITDSIFPIGAYSHSFGLETYVQKNLLTNKEDALNFISYWLQYSFLYTDLLSALLAYDATQCKSMETIDRIEEIIEASRIPFELREASRKLGSRFCKLVQSTMPIEATSFFSKYIEHRLKRNTYYPSAYGIFCAELGLDKEEILLRYIYSQASAMVTNAVKCIPLSQTDGQQILYELQTTIENMVERVQALDESWLCVSTPLFDLRSMEHEHLYSRLYMS